MYSIAFLEDIKYNISKFMTVLVGNHVAGYSDVGGFPKIYVFNASMSNIHLVCRINKFKKS